MTECDQKKYNGKIEIHGKIFLDQFFSVGIGISDADTVKISLSPNSIRFREREDHNWQEGLTVLNNAYYYDEDDGRRKKVIIRDGKNNEDQIRIRLQGIDAPELHYRANRGNVFLYSDQFSKFTSLNQIFEFRQNWGS